MTTAGAGGAGSSPSRDLPPIVPAQKKLVQPAAGTQFSKTELTELFKRTDAPIDALKTSDVPILREELEKCTQNIQTSRRDYEKANENLQKYKSDLANAERDLKSLKPTKADEYAKKVAIFDDVIRRCKEAIPEAEATLRTTEKRMENLKNRFGQITGLLEQNKDTPKFRAEKAKMIQKDIERFDRLQSQISPKPAVAPSPPPARSTPEQDQLLLALGKDHSVKDFFGEKPTWKEVTDVLNDQRPVGNLRERRNLFALARALEKETANPLAKELQAKAETRIKAIIASDNAVIKDQIGKGMAAAISNFTPIAKSTEAKIFFGTDRQLAQQRDNFQLSQTADYKTFGACFRNAPDLKSGGFAADVACTCQFSNGLEIGVVVDASGHHEISFNTADKAVRAFVQHFETVLREKPINTKEEFVAVYTEAVQKANEAALRQGEQITLTPTFKLPPNADKQSLLIGAQIGDGGIIIYDPAKEEVYIPGSSKAEKGYHGTGGSLGDGRALQADSFPGYVAFSKLIPPGAIVISMSDGTKDNLNPITQKVTPHEFITELEQYEQFEKRLSNEERAEYTRLKAETPLTDKKQHLLEAAWGKSPNLLNLYTKVQITRALGQNVAILPPSVIAKSFDTYISENITKELRSALLNAKSDAEIKQVLNQWEKAGKPDDAALVVMVNR